jgi:hypothetical protein
VTLPEGVLPLDDLDDLDNAPPEQERWEELGLNTLS